MVFRASPARSPGRFGTFSSTPGAYSVCWLRDVSGVQDVPRIRGRSTAPQVVELDGPADVRVLARSTISSRARTASSMDARSGRDLRARVSRCSACCPGCARGTTPAHGRAALSRARPTRRELVQPAHPFVARSTAADPRLRRDKNSRHAFATSGPVDSEHAVVRLGVAKPQTLRR
jgi:hypothetical protein